MERDEKRSELKTNITESYLRNSIDTSFETTSNPPAPQTSYSMFGDGSCGEPLLAQHLVINFSPITKLDNEFVQRKCCAFWKFVRSHPELKNIMEFPNPNAYANTSISSDKTSQNSKAETKKQLEHKDITALSMLECVERKGLINRTFEAKLPRSSCSLGSREYHENDTSIVDKSAQRIRNVIFCDCNGICELCSKGRSHDETTNSVFEVQALCDEMRTWDKEHPRSCETPKHPPVLSHCIMQRKFPV